MLIVHCDASSSVTYLTTTEASTKHVALFTEEKKKQD